jgi:hypothetical protein
MKLAKRYGIVVLPFVLYVLTLASLAQSEATFHERGKQDIEELVARLEKADMSSEQRKHVRSYAQVSNSNVSSYVGGVGQALASGFFVCFIPLTFWAASQRRDAQN